MRDKMDDLIVADLGYIPWRVACDTDMPDDFPGIVSKNKVREVALQMDRIALDHVDWVFQSIENYDY